jgi:hypothetical protein
MQGKSSAAYDGQWSGLNITHLFTGLFNGRPRAFAVVHHDSGSNALWEIMPQMQQQVADELVSCTAAGPASVTSQIPCYLETAVRSFGNARHRKSLNRFDVYLSEMDGQVDLKLWWRADGKAKWNQWDALTVNAKTTDPQGSTPHTWKNLTKQARTQLKSFTIPQGLVGADGYGLHTGFEFQFRLGWTGRCKIYKMSAFAKASVESLFARRDLVSANPMQEDITGNELTYSIDVDFGFDGQLVEITTQPTALNLTSGGNGTLTMAATGSGVIVYQWQVSTDNGSTWNNVNDGGWYSGATTPVLTITGSVSSMNGYKYRCSANNGWSERGCTGGGSSAVYTSESSLKVYSGISTDGTDGFGNPYSSHSEAVLHFDGTNLHISIDVWTIAWALTAYWSQLNVQVQQQDGTSWSSLGLAFNYPSINASLAGAYGGKNFRIIMDNGGRSGQTQVIAYIST